MAAAVQVREGHVDVTGGRIWYRVVGSGEAVPLVTVHGGPGATHDSLEPLEPLRTTGRSASTTSSAWAAPTSLTTSACGLTPASSTKSADSSTASTSLGSTYSASRGERSSPPSTPSNVRTGRRAGFWPTPASAFPATRPAPLPSAPVAGGGGAVLDRHEAAGTMDSEEYEAASMEFYRRHVCRLDPWPDVLVQTFAQLNRVVYERMQGPSEFVITGIHEDYDATERLGRLAVPTLFLCGRFDETRPEETAWYQSLVPGTELVVFEHTATCRTWRSRGATSRCCATSWIVPSSARPRNEGSGRGERWSFADEYTAKWSTYLAGWLPPTPVIPAQQPGPADIEPMRPARACERRSWPDLSRSDSRSRRRRRRSHEDPAPEHGTGGGGWLRSRDRGAPRGCTRRDRRGRNLRYSGAAVVATGEGGTCVPGVKQALHRPRRLFGPPVRRLVAAGPGRRPRRRTPRTTPPHHHG